MVAQLGLGISPNVVGPLIVKLERNGPVKVRYGAAIVAQLILGTPPEKVGVRILRLKLNGPVRVRYGTAIVALLPFGNPPVVVGIRIVKDSAKDCRHEFLEHQVILSKIISI